MGLFLKKRVEMPDKMILGNTEFVFDRKLGFHVGEWTVWDRKTKILLEFQSTEGNIGDIVLEKVNWVNDNKDTIIINFMTGSWNTIWRRLTRCSLQQKNDRITEKRRHCYGT